MSFVTCYFAGLQEMLNEAVFSIVSDGSCAGESLPDLTGNMLCADGAEGSGVCTVSSCHRLKTEPGHELDFSW